MNIISLRLFFVKKKIGILMVLLLLLMWLLFLVVGCFSIFKKPCKT